MAPSTASGTSSGAALVVVLPVVLAAAVLESRRSGATPGKRMLRLQVSGPAGRPAFGEALVRNALKLGVPWLLGHSAVFAIVLTSSTRVATPSWVWALTGAAYVLPLVYLVTVCTPSGRTPYDRLARTQVLPRA